MRKLSLALLVVAISVLCGCRREDVREVTLEIPGATPANVKQVEGALSRYGGVRKDSFKWDMQSKTLTLQYDSMKVAQTNLRMAVEETGIEIVFPTKTEGPAGY